MGSVENRNRDIAKSASPGGHKYAGPISGDIGRNNGYRAQVLARISSVAGLSPSERTIGATANDGGLWWPTQSKGHKTRLLSACSTNASACCLCVCLQVPASSVQATQLSRVETPPHAENALKPGPNAETDTLEGLK